MMRRPRRLLLMNPGPVNVSERVRKAAYALGSVSGVSWLSAFILGTMRASPLPFSQLLGIYVLALGGAILVSQLLERRSA